MDAIEGACSATDGGAVNKESFNAPSNNKENESNDAVVRRRRPLLSSTGRGNIVLRTRSDAPSTSSTKSKARKRLFHEVDNTITHDNGEGVSNVWLGQFARCTKFIRTIFGRTSAEPKGNQHSENNVVPFQLGSRHHCHHQSEHLRQHARQFTRKSTSKKREYYKSRIGPPTQRDGNDQDLPYESAIENVVDDLEFHSGQLQEALYLRRAAIYLREQNAAIRIQALARAMAARNLFMAIKSMHDEANDEMDTHDDADEGGENSDIELDEAVLQMDEEEGDAEDDEETATMQTQQHDDDEILEEVEGVEKVDNQVDNGDEDCLQYSAEETIESVAGMEMHGAADVNSPTLSSLSCNDDESEQDDLCKFQSTPMNLIPCST